MVKIKQGDNLNSLQFRIDKGNKNDFRRKVKFRRKCSKRATKFNSIKKKCKFAHRRDMQIVSG